MFIQLNISVYNGHPGTELTGHCREEVVIVGTEPSIRVKGMDRRTVRTKHPGCCRDEETLELFGIINKK